MYDKFYPAYYRLKELIQMMTPADESKIDKSELAGRKSGSAAWRLARGEMGMLTGVESGSNAGKVIWRPTEKEIEARVFHLEYDVVRNEYIRCVHVTALNEAAF